jgi:hypothetical protein
MNIFGFEKKQKAKYTNLRYGWVVLPTNEKLFMVFQFFRCVYVVLMLLVLTGLLPPGGGRGGT